MIPLPASFLNRPIAHRALHGPGAPENSRAAVQRAVAAGYGIEIDLQLSRDGAAMVFHDYDLSRLTAARGPVRQHLASELADMTLTGGGDGIPTLEQILEIVAGQVPLLIEIKDQDGALGPDIGALEQAAAQTLARYTGPVAVMSFNPHAVAAMQNLAPALPRGLITCSFAAEDWPTVPAATRDRLRDIPDYDRVGAGFVSHDATDLDNPRVGDLRQAGAAILCWTVRSAQAEISARRIAHNVTFEGYTA